MSDNDKPKFTFAQAAALKSAIDAETDPETKINLYEALTNQLRWPRKRRSDMTATELAERRERRRVAREQGINLRTGKPWTEEQRAKQAARWTPEARAAAAEKNKGRKQTPEALANIRAAAKARQDKKLAMEARLAELEAMLAAKQGGDEESVPSKRGRK